MSQEQTKGNFSVLDYALNYAKSFGFRVFPVHTINPGGACTCGNAVCTSPGKHPMTRRGVLDASTDENQIRAWFGDMGTPDANIGIATGRDSNLVVVDVDEAKGADIDDLWKGFNLSLDKLDTPLIKTGGGLHFYFQYPKTQEIKNSASRLGKFIDVRGDGGYVVAPPSRHVSGKIYEFENNVETLLDFPAEWAQKLAQPIITPSAANNGNANNLGGSGLHVPPPASNLIVPESINQGARNYSLTKIAGALRRTGLNDVEIEAALLHLNQRVCQPPLPISEIQHISKSVNRYTANEIDAVDDDSAEYENSFQPYSLDTFFDIEFGEKEILGFHIGKRDIAIIQAGTNAGKTTLLRNISLCMAAGRRFHPFYEGARPIKIGYFDFENDAQDAQRDLKTMFSAMTDKEKQNVKNNFVVIPKGLLGGELFQFNSHEKVANEIVRDNNVEFVVVDNVSAAYDLNDENSNAEVTKKVIKPLLKMAYKNNCAFLFAHHYGKGKNELESAGVHAGRGASALQSLSRTVINMFGDVSKGEPATVECAKRKADGGQNYREVFRLDDDRWFHHTTIVPPPKKLTAYQTIRTYMETIVYPNLVSTADVITKFQNEYGVDSIKKAINELFKDGFIEKPKHGYYCAKDLAVANSQNVKPKNYYEKNDD